MTPLIASLLFYYQQIALGSTSPAIIKDFIATEATIAGVNPTLAINIATDESGLNPKEIGDFGTSFSLFQIHLPAHQDISKKQAQDIIFNVEWSMAEMKKNGCTAWSTCNEAKSQLNAVQSLTDLSKSPTDGT
jgi:hypothetical protein